MEPVSVPTFSMWEKDVFSCEGDIEAQGWMVEADVSADSKGFMMLRKGDGKMFSTICRDLRFRHTRLHTYFFVSAHTVVPCPLRPFPGVCDGEPRVISRQPDIQYLRGSQLCNPRSVFRRPSTRKAGGRYTDSESKPCVPET